MSESWPQAVVLLDIPAECLLPRYAEVTVTPLTFDIRGKLRAREVPQRSCKHPGHEAFTYHPEPGSAGCLITVK